MAPSESTASTQTAETATLPNNNNNDDDDESEEEDPPEPSGFELIKTKFEKLDNLLSKIQIAFEEDDTSNTVPPNNTDETPNNGGVATVKSDAEKKPERREEQLRKDVKYIRKNVAYIRKNVLLLEESRYKEGADQLLQHLMNAANQSPGEFRKNSPNLNHLLVMVARLKLWIPLHPPEEDEESKMKKSKTKKKKKKKESPIVSKKDSENAAAEIVKTLVNYDCKDWGMNGLLKSYGELEVRDKLCLLCFSAFTCDVDQVRKPRVLAHKNSEINKETLIQENSEIKKETLVQENLEIQKDVEINKEPLIQENVEIKKTLVQKYLVIKKKILIFWWVGEGFIDPPIPPVKIADIHPTPNSVAQQNSIPNQSSVPNQSEKEEQKRETIETIGEAILETLRKKGFIEPVMKRGRESGSYQMHPFVHSFVTALAKKAGFFDFSNLDGNLIPQFTLSQRACLLKPHGEFFSSCRIWKDAIDNRAKLKKFATVQTLFNVNESIIDIRPEWFSKMKYLSVLHLGSWRSEAGEHIEVEDTLFMEELKNMKQLKLFSLQGVATIMKLPDSVCKLSNLIILDLRECHNLEILPADIGSLKNLTHLDITNCHLLTKLPIGISLLSKLEVLNGFVIYNQVGVREHKKGCFSSCWKKTKKFVVHDVFRAENKEVCNLQDLLKLRSLRELSITVNRDEFPNKEETEMLMEMRELCSLKISWVYDFKDLNDESGEVTSKCGCCLLCKKTERRDANAQSSQMDTNQNSGGGSFKELEKLEMWCFPGTTAPEWMVPDKLVKLKKLYIKGGKLKSLGNLGEDKGGKLKSSGNLGEDEGGKLKSSGEDEGGKLKSSGEDEGGKPKSLGEDEGGKPKSLGEDEGGKPKSSGEDEGGKPKSSGEDEGGKLKSSGEDEGGKLKSSGEDENRWNVETLRLKYLKELEIEWRKLLAMFPKMMYLEKYECKKLGLFPCDHDGVWLDKKKIAAQRIKDMENKPIVLPV